MQFEFKYGKARSTAVPGWSASPERVINDLVGLRDDDHYARYMAAYPLPVVSSAPLRDKFVEALECANAGRVWQGIAADLESVRHEDGGRFDAPDIEALGAWAIVHYLHTDGPPPIGRCERCLALWITREEDAFCHRPAPGTGVTCRALEAEHRYRAAHEAFRKERRRLYEQTRRGSLDEEIYKSWLAENRPGQWQPFNAWKEARRA